jgi:DNA-directed RNA polymerase alpha subunit
MSQNLKKKLRVFGVNTFKELLSQYSEADFKKFRLFGEKTISEFKELLQKNNCRSLFDKDK